MNRKSPGYINRYFKEGNGRAVFVRNFRNECRITPHRLIRHLRMEYAGYLARLSELAAGQVAPVCGFNDSRIFANILLKESFL